MNEIVETEIVFPVKVTNGDVTVKIYRVKSATSPTGWYYQVQDRSGTARKLISRTDFAKAKEEATRIAKLQREGEHRALEMRGPQRHAYAHAVQLLAPSQTPLEDAALRYAEAVKILGQTPLGTAIARYAEAAEALGDGSKLVEAAKFFIARTSLIAPGLTVSKLVEEMLALKTKRAASVRYIDDLKSRLERFAKDFPGKVSEVRTEQVQNWLDDLRFVVAGKEKLLSGQSYKNYRTAIGVLFKYAETRGYIPKGSSPVDAVEKRNGDPGETEIFTPTEFVTLLNAAKPDYLPSLAIGGFAGLRSAEIQRLEWSDVDLQSRCITVSADDAKTASRRTVPICDALAAWLKKPSADSTGLIWTKNGNDFVNAQRRTAKTAALKWKGNALRHSYASYRLSETGDAVKVAFEMGNSAPIVHRHYKELVKPADAKAWFSIMPPQG